MPTSTVAPTSTPPLARVEPAATRITNAKKEVPTGEISLLAPANDFALPNAQAEFQWEWNGVSGCEPLPAGYGFEISIWADTENAAPAGAMDAAGDQAGIRCDPKSGIRSFTVGDIRIAPGVRQSSTLRLRWRVAIVQLDPYRPVHISPSRVINLAEK